MAKRLRGRYGYPADEPFRVTLHPERLEEPLHWKNPQRVFVVSMGDLFHDDVQRDDILRVWMTMARCPQHTFLVLTKRAERMQRLLSEWWPLPNVLVGVTAENQAAADERIPLLLQTPAAKRFVSCEPLLGPIDVAPWLSRSSQAGPDGQFSDRLGHHGCLHWVIAGGETGPGARPMHPDWARSLCDQSQVAGVPFFFKSWGDWVSEDQAHGLWPEKASGDPKLNARQVHAWPDGTASIRHGKKAAGRLLDGCEWNEFPETKA